MPALSIAVGLLVWLAVDSSIDGSLVMAGPQDVLRTIPEEIDDGYFGHLLVSARELALGMVLSIGIGVPTGVMMGLSRSTRSVLQPWVAAVSATPTIALAPVIILWLGLGTESKVFIVTLLSIFPILVNTESGVRGTSDDHVEMARAFRLNRWAIFGKIYLRSALPTIVAGIRLGTAAGIIGVVVGELFGSKAGLGYSIIINTQLFDIPAVYFIIGTLSCSGMVLAGLLKLLENRAAPWRVED